MAKRRYKRRYAKRDRRPRWAKIMHTGFQMYNNFKGPLGYALRGVNMLKNLINTETKYIDTVVNTNTNFDNTTGQMNALSLCSQGVSDTSRIGNSILCKHLTINWAVSLNNSNTNGNRFRLIIFIDKQNAKGVAPSATDILTAVTPTALKNVDNLDRFVILRDIMGNVDPDKPVVNGKIYIPLHRLHTKYDGTLGQQSDLAENGIYLLGLTNQNTNLPFLNFQARLAFYDN